MNKLPANKDSDKSQTDIGAGGVISALVFMFVMTGLLAFWPEIRQLIPGLRVPDKVQSLGPVQRSSFVGGLVTDTQVDVASGSLLLRGAVEIQRGAPVERRVNPLGEWLCVVGTEHCHDIRSHRQDEAEASAATASGSQAAPVETSPSQACKPKDTP